MSEEEIQTVTAMLKLLVFPIVGFIAGFFTKWFLQTKKSRNELLRELSATRVEKMMSLWELTTPFALSPKEQTTIEKRNIADMEFRKWYYDKSGAMFLSWKGTKRYFEAIDTLRNINSSPEQLKNIFSLLRTQLKQDSGIYTWWSSFRQLPTPRKPLNTPNNAKTNKGK